MSKPIVCLSEQLKEAEISESYEETWNTLDLAKRQLGSIIIYRAKGFKSRVHMSKVMFIQEEIMWAETKKLCFLAKESNMEKSKNLNRKSREIHYEGIHGRP